MLARQSAHDNVWADCKTILLHLVQERLNIVSEKYRCPDIISFMSSIIPGHFYIAEAILVSLRRRIILFEFDPD